MRGREAAERSECGTSPVLVAVVRLAADRVVVLGPGSIEELEQLQASGAPFDKHLPKSCTT